MSGRSIEVQGVQVPGFMYGTAWKEEATQALVMEALRAGFRAIDTANQRKHYFEAGVGEALRQAQEEGLVGREELFLQSKFTFEAGQDHRLPYDPQASVGEQVAQSFASSLEHLGLERLDSLVLHGPSQFPGIGEADREAWRAMEALRAEGKVALLGLSNVSAEQLEAFLELAQQAPAFVQNRCYARRGWDGQVRRICARESIVYQGFSLLTANRAELSRPAVAEMARSLEASIPQVVFRFAQQVGMLPLTGTTDAQHMREDLAGERLELEPSQVALLEALGQVG